MSLPRSFVKHLLLLIVGGYCGAVVVAQLLLALNVIQ
jgi:hypothetical protein